MSFEIQINPITDFQEIRLTDKSNGNSIAITTKGGLLNEWLSEGVNAIIHGNDFSRGWGSFEINGFKSGKMNPFSCRLANGQYQHEEQDYKIEKFYLGPHALHGIQYDAVYSIESTHLDEYQASVILVYHYKGTDKGFPFPYSMHLKWILKTNNIIVVTTAITNHHHQAIPMMDGWHPYFQLGNGIDDCIIQFKNKGKIEYDEQLLPTGKILADNTFDEGKVLDNTHLDDCWMIDEAVPNCTIQKEHQKIIITPIANYPYIQLYTPEDRQSIAIENLSAAPNCFNNKMGLHIVKPHETWELITSYQYIIS
jgi:aldose 1-epimerase